MNKNVNNLILLTCLVFCWACKQNSSNMANKGTFGYDVQFLSNHTQPVILSDDDSSSMIIVSPEYQGRVMTSTTNGQDGYSFGWINYDLIRSGETKPHMNAFGGEERLWLGPEGGQYSIFFKPDVPFTFENWFTPSEIDTEPFQLTNQSRNSASFKKEMQLQNYARFVFQLTIERHVRLLSREEIKLHMGSIIENTSMVGYESENILTNTGNKNWKKETGLLSIWMLGMLNPSPEAIIFIPYREGPVDSLGYIVNDNYFGEIPDDRLKIRNGIIYFMADGKYRSKIGISPERATSYAASYDPLNNALTILEVEIPKNKTDYVNSAWEIQENPYDGDVINAYNDGPLEDGSQLGPFYELESSSPAVELKPGDSISHVQRTYHFSGNEASLSNITENLFNVTIEQIKETF